MSWTLGVDQDLQPESSRSMRETSSLLVHPDVFGRAEEKEKLIKLLLGTTGDGHVPPSGLSVLSIVGMGGLGKTTLAQWVYNSKEIEEYFQLRIWVWVSHDYDLKRVTKQILEHVGDPKSGLQNIDSLNVLQETLAEGLKGKRFLLVLDDVWEEHPSRWFEFSAPLTRGQKGSTVLITTRHASVTSAVQSVKIELQGLPFKDSWSIFKSHAFPGGDSSRHPRLDSIGEEIVKKVKGIPLAARTIGGLLRFESEERKWRDVLRSELWELQDGGGIIPALRVSYEYLPFHLKRCFAYCSVYPKGHGFKMLDLVQLWMAQGYIRPQGRKPVGDVGRHCLNELLNRSLIQSVNGKYVVHDLLHDLGQLISQNDYYKIEGDEVREVPKEAHSNRHLLLCYEKSTVGGLQVLYEFRKPRTFLLKLNSSTNIVLFHIPSNLSDTMVSLRVLDLSYCGIETLPDSIECLKHLRFLSLRGAPITCLPESLCSLYKLQTLLLQECDQLNILPERMSNLISLHYLEAKPELVCKIVGIGRLTCLQNLQVFSVSEGNGNKIGDLKDMNELQGKLRIQNLQRVVSGEEAMEAMLDNKQYLETVEMEWADDRYVDQIDNYLEESILEGLHPPPELNELILKHYAGINLPSWMNISSISSLEFIHMHRCIDLNHLPTTLTNLTLRDVRLNALPDSLCHLPLQKLVICQIPELRELPLLPATLKELTIESAGLEALPEFDQGHGLSVATSEGRGEDEDEDSDRRKPSLSILKIHGCPHLKTLDVGLLQHPLRHLRVLSIKDCKELVSWPAGEGFLATLSSLKEELSVEDCHKLECLPEGNKLATSLKKLTVKYCLGIPSESLFSQLHNLDSDDVWVQKYYCHSAYCSYEMLSHLQSVGWLNVKFFPATADTLRIVTGIYDRTRTWCWSLNDGDCLTPRATLIILAPVADADAVAVVDNDTPELLSNCLRGHAWTSSLRMLTLDNVPDTAFLGVRRPLLLPSLESLWIWNCREMRRLPTETILCCMTSLKELRISQCPELTLSSLQEGIQSLPSLDALYIEKCPQLLAPPASNDQVALSVPPVALPLPPPPTLLRHLFIDDVRLLPRLLVDNTRYGQCSARGRPFRDHLLTSLRFLRVDDCDCAFVAGEVEEGLKTLASTLQGLALVNCPNLRSLPADLRGLLPNLKALAMDNCPALQHLPDRGLPASLQFLRINGCPTLTERCRPRPWATPPSMRLIRRTEEHDWHRITHVPVIAIDRSFLRGSYSRFLGLQAKWDFLF